MVLQKSNQKKCLSYHQGLACLNDVEAESLESIYMQTVLCEVQKRCYAPSIIWLHDGFWISNSVNKAAIEAAEKVALT